MTLTWGATTLWTKRVKLPCDVHVAEVDARVVGGREACELRVAQRVHGVCCERPLWVEYGGFELFVDATSNDVAPAVAASINPRSAAADAGSLLLHASAGLVLFVLADPLAKETLAPLEELAVVRPEPQLILELAQPSEPLTRDDRDSAPDTDPRPVDPAGPGATQLAPRGQVHQPSAGAASLAQAERSEVDGAREAETWSMISLLEVSRGGARKAATGDSPWAAAGIDTGPSWGSLGGVGDDGGLGGLSLSGIGEGGGSRSAGIGLGAAGVASCGAHCPGATGPLPGHEAKPISVRVCGGSRTQSVALSKPTGGCSMGGGRLPPETIQRVVRQNFGLFRGCYEKDLPTQPGLQSRVTVSFTIARDGSVASASASAESLASSTASCVAKAFAGISFPQPEGGVVRVVYPITFSPG